MKNKAKQTCVVACKQPTYSEGTYKHQKAQQKAGGGTKYSLVLTLLWHPPLAAPEPFTKPFSQCRSKAGWKHVVLGHLPTHCAAEKHCLWLYRTTVHTRHRSSFSQAPPGPDQQSPAGAVPPQPVSLSARQRTSRWISCLTAPRLPSEEPSPRIHLPKERCFHKIW